MRTHVHKFVVAGFLILLLTAVTSAAIPARADEELSFDWRDLRPVARMSLVGAAAGAATGLVVWPLSGRFNSLPIGVGVGGILGAGVGIYHVLNRDDPENPLSKMEIGTPSREVPIQLSYRFEF